MFHRMILVVFLVITASVLTAQSPRNASSDENSSKVRALLQERRDVLAKRLEMVERMFEIGRLTFVETCDARDDLLAAEIDLAETPAQRIEAMKSRIANLKKIEDFHIESQKQARSEELDVLLAKSHRLLAEIDLEHAQESQ